MSSIGYIDRVTQHRNIQITWQYSETLYNLISLCLSNMWMEKSLDILSSKDSINLESGKKWAAAARWRSGGAQLGQLWDQQTMCASPGRRGWHKSNWGGAGCIVTTLIKYLGPGTGSNLYIMDSLQFISDIFPPQPSCVSGVCRCVMRGWMWRSRNNSNSYSRQGIICEYLLFVYLRVLLSSPPAV